ncbi:hypothetical protein PbJCM13498_08760 [Prolixibacter bellariivorans]|uniref:DUF541 domain-containing protein n=1 Tax=Prolixibacter bellariivorans TaxID=314319 RepID=A0A5M4AWI3_9BACT|nr:hypothetical protein [Prolixibacter bellariivorans]GET32013.1 hypothetical protein PbJCM13498_08760 [Prolixibacter bellariivorans]
MKTIVFISFILGFFTTSAFSQNKLSLKLDTTGIDVSAYTDLGRYSQMSKQQQMTAPTLAEVKKLLKENTQAKGLRNTPTPENILQNNTSYDNMPCLKPMLADAMPVLKPDSTVHYTLRIKKVK